MRLFRTLPAVLAPLLALAPAAEAQRWFTTEIVAPAPTAAPLPASGYARFYVTSHLDPLQARPYHAHRDFALLVVNVSISPGGGAQPVEYPVALYDLRQRRRVEVAALQLGEVRYLDLRAGLQPVVTVRVQAVPAGVAAPFRRALDQFNRQIQATPLLDLTGQVSGLSRLLGSILPPEVEESWTSTQTIGLTQRPDLTVLPLDGRPAAIFFRPPGGGNVRVPADASEVRPCPGATGRMCWTATGEQVSGVPYIVLSVTVEDYRLLRDFGVPDFVCSPPAIAELVGRVERVVRDAPLSQEQRDLESRLLEQLRLVGEAASGRLASTEGAASAAFRWTRRYQGRGDPYWTAHAAETSERYRRCLDQVVTALGPAAATRWTYFSDAFATAAAWDRQPPAPAGEARQAQLEEFLSTILLPITVYRLGEGEENLALRAEQRRIEAELLAGDRVLAAEAASARTVPALEAARARMQARLATPCESCRELLSSAIAATDERIAALERTAAATAELARLREALATAQGEAGQVAAAAAGIEGADPAALDALRARIEAGRLLLADREAPAEALSAALAALTDAMERVRAGLGAEVGTDG
jgi:hypothetical protein